MLSELKVEPSRSTCTIKRNDGASNDSNSENIEYSKYSTDFDIKILEENFRKFDLELKHQRIFDKTKPINFTKNWYSEPTPLDLQFEENFSSPNFLFLLINCMNRILMVYLNRKS